MGVGPEAFRVYDRLVPEVGYPFAHGVSQRRIAVDLPSYKEPIAPSAESDRSIFLAELRQLVGIARLRFLEYVPRGLFVIDIGFL